MLDLAYPGFDVTIAAFTTVLFRVARRAGDSDSARGYALLGIGFVLMALVDIVLADVQCEAALYRAVPD